MIGKWKNARPGYKLEIKKGGQRKKFKFILTVPSESTVMKGIVKEERSGGWKMTKKFKYKGDESK